MKTNGERKLMNAAIRRGSIGAMVLAFVLCLASVRAADVPCCGAITRPPSVPVAPGCAMMPTADACVLAGGRVATSCRACMRTSTPMIHQPGAADGDGNMASDVVDETASSDLEDAPGAAQPESAWTLLVATMFLMGL